VAQPGSKVFAERLPAGSDDSASPVRVVVLDFDGTLVDSNAIKRAAYYRLFPAGQDVTALIDGVLVSHYEESRYRILERILVALRRNSIPVAGDAGLDALARRYDDIVRDGAKRCPEIPGAGELLRALGRRFTLYLSSTTPMESLRDIVACRGWTSFFRAMYGYPAEKTATLREIIAREHITADKLVVFGDGESDRTSAGSVGCGFFPAGDASLIQRLRDVLGC
jgi:phosphoglycolate phosphatase-like HAD superfamily hydrolase